MGWESWGQVIETPRRGGERVRVIATARRANAACGLDSGATREAPLGEVRVFRLGFVNEAPGNEDQCDKEHVESDKGCEREKDFHDRVGFKSSGNLMTGGGLRRVHSTLPMRDRLRLRLNRTDSFTLCVRSAVLFGARFAVASFR